MSTLTKKYPSHFGIDAKSNDLNRPDQFAYNVRNSQNRLTSGIEKRKGFQAHGGSVGGNGLFTYNRVSPTTSQDEAEILTIDSSLHRKLVSTLKDRKSVV